MTAEEMVQAYSSMLYKICIVMLCNEQDAQDAIQDTFCIACAKRKQCLASADPRRWIMCTLKDVGQNVRRTQAKLKKLLLSLNTGECQDAGTPDPVSVDVLFGDLSDSEDFRLLKRIALDRCTMLEVAEELGISLESCKKRVQRARKRLQEKIEACI